MRIHRVLGVALTNIVDAMVAPRGSSAEGAAPMAILDAESVTRIENVSIENEFGEETLYNLYLAFTNAIEL
jgi:hypothetical protein